MHRRLGSILHYEGGYTPSVAANATSSALPQKEHVHAGPSSEYSDGRFHVPAGVVPGPVFWKAVEVVRRYRRVIAHGAVATVLASLGVLTGSLIRLPQFQS